MAKRRPNGDGMIRKRTDGRWEGRITVGHKSDGKPIYRSVLANTQSELLPKLNALKETYAGVELNEDSCMTLGEWLDKWLNEYVAFTVRESTLESYRDLANNQIKRFIGDKQLSALKTVDIQKLYNKVKTEGRVREHPILGYALSDSVVRKVHMMLHQALDVAVREHLIPNNPTNGTTIPKCNYAEKQIFCDSQLDIFLEVIKGEEYWHDFFYTEIMTGLRRGEICGLKWSDLNMDTGKLRVQRSVSVKKGGGVNIGETKTDKGVRSITLPQSVIEMLHTRRQTAISEWIFPNLLQPEYPVSPAAAYRKLKVILKRAELPMIRFHDLRHTFATHAMQGGVDAKTLSGILGHTNASFTLDTYTHVTADMQKNASDVVSNMMKNIMVM
ncbi:MAG: site-specific integrase [Clostridia bacterium]|nr:site-specific integrase [Clostridia bacterium]